jgi:hypothetical protein
VHCDIHTTLDLASSSPALMSHALSLTVQHLILCLPRSQVDSKAGGLLVCQQDW